jgi:Ankyrin repeats (3 copies)/Ankyrin repeat
VQSYITKTCITYLSFNVFGSGFCLSDKEFEDRLQLHPFYDYAVRNWGYHNYENTGTQCSIPIFFGSEAKVSAYIQALMVSTGYRYTEYSQKFPQQMTAVHLAARFGLTEMVVILVENGYNSDCNNSNRRTPLSYAAERGHKAVVKVLVARDDVAADSKDNEYGQTPLSWAAENGHEGVVKLLVERDDVEADSKAQNGRTPLSWAVENGPEGGG